MTNQFNSATLLPQVLDGRGELLVRLIYFLDRIEWDGKQETLMIRNGAPSIKLDADRTIHIEDERILQSAAQDINIAASWIDPN